MKQLLFEVLMDKVKKFSPYVMSIFIAFVFVQSLFFKFTNAAEPQYIFSTLNTWAADTFGIEGLFLPPGIFNQYVIGGAELVASIMVLVGVFAGKRALLGLGGLLSTGIMSGAIVFHLFTPLGVVIESAERGIKSDGGALFTMACIVWVFGLVLAAMNRPAFCPIYKCMHKDK